MAEGRVFWGAGLLLASIVAPVLFKTVIVVQSYFLPRGYPQRTPGWFRFMSIVNIALGALAVLSFLSGIVCLVAAAQVLLGAPVTCLC